MPHVPIDHKRLSQVIQRPHSLPRGRRPAAAAVVVVVVAPGRQNTPRALHGPYYTGRPWCLAWS
jgi:hypothetical protein